MSYRTFGQNFIANLWFKHNLSALLEHMLNAIPKQRWSLFPFISFQQGSNWTGLTLPESESLKKLV